MKCNKQSRRLVAFQRLDLLHKDGRAKNILRLNSVLKYNCTTKFSHQQQVCSTSQKCILMEKPWPKGAGRWSCLINMKTSDE